MTVKPKESKKRVPIRTIRLKINAGQATPKPPSGSGVGAAWMKYSRFL